MRQTAAGSPTRQELRERILDAAALYLAQNESAGAASIDAIAANCGERPSTVLQEFGSIAGIRAALLALWSERLSAWITSA